jgi:hypothetical protein
MEPLKFQRVETEIAGLQRARSTDPVGARIVTKPFSVSGNSLHTDMVHKREPTPGDAKLGIAGYPAHPPIAAPAGV